MLMFSIKLCIDPYQ